jgi:hypothetical protein
VPATPGRYLDLDLVAVAINLGLAQSLPRKISTTIVAGFFHQWASAVGYAEADRKRDYFMAVGGIGWDEAKRGPQLLVLTNGTLDQITEDFRGTRDLVGFFTVNVSDIIRRLRQKAQAVGIDLGRPFFFPPEDARFAQILNQVKRERDGRIARLRQDKDRFAAAKRRAQGENITEQNITESARVRHRSYPMVMREIFSVTPTAQ